MTTLLTGGSRNSSSSVLAKLHALHEAETTLDCAKAVAKEAGDAARKAGKEATATAKLEAAFDHADHALGLIKGRVAGRCTLNQADP